MRNWIECKALNGITVAVLEQSLQFIRPNDDSLIGTTACKFLTVPRVVNTVYCILVPLKWLQQCAVHGAVDQDPVPTGYDQLGAIWVEAKIVNTESGGLLSGSMDICFMFAYHCSFFSLSWILSTHSGSVRIL